DAFHQTDIGLEAAGRLGRFEPHLGMSLQKAVVNAIAEFDIFEEEVEARLALADYEAATALAQSAVLNEDKLRLLAAVAGARDRQGLPEDPDLMVQIRELAATTPSSALGSKAFDIAADLIGVDAELAISVAEGAKSG